MSVLPRIALFLQYVLPRNSRNTQNLLAVYSPTDCTDFHRCCFQGGALVSSAPTRSVVALLALLVHLRQVHPLKEPICVDLCNLWENTFSNLFRGFREFCGRISQQSVLPVNLLLAMLAQIGVALREVVVAEPPATVGRQR